MQVSSCTPMLSNPLKPTTSTDALKPTPQYRYQSNAEDQRLINELVSWLWQGTLTQITPAHIYAASLAVRKEIAECLRVRRVEVSSYEEPHDSQLTPAESLTPPKPCLTYQPEPEYSLLVQEIDINFPNGISEPGLFDPGSQIIVMRQDLVQEINAQINSELKIEMEGANSFIDWTLGCTQYVPMQLGDVPFKLHVHIVPHAPFRLLLGHPFQWQLLSCAEDLPNGMVEISICDPLDISCRIYIPSRPRRVQATSIRVLSYAYIPTSPSIYAPHLAYQSTPISMCPPQHHATSLAYKKVARKVHPIPASLPEDFCNIHCIPEDPLLSLSPLPTSPPNFVSGHRLTQDRLDALELNRFDFLWPEELKLLQHVLWLNELGLAWTEEEKGRFRNDYFLPVKIPVIEHVPWIHKNIPIPYSILDDVIHIFKDKLAAGVYEPSDTSYRLQWHQEKPPALASTKPGVNE
jgi:hypothetical protein